MTAARWSNQDTYADLIDSIAAANGVPASLAYGLIAQESRFIPTATRNEPTYNCHGVIGDTSYGLTQVLTCTAAGLGYTGTPFGLFDPATNLSLGLLLLGRLLASHGGDVAAALSAYNGGDRPALGYGARRADGTFANQAYIDNVLANVDYFDAYLADQSAAGGDGTIDPNAGTIDPNAGTIDPNAGTIDPNAGTAGGVDAGVIAGAVGAVALGALLVRWLRS